MIYQGRLWTESLYRSGVRIRYPLYGPDLNWSAEQCKAKVQLTFH